MSTPDNLRRYSPTVGSDEDFLKQFSNPDERRLATATILAAAFTPLTEELYDRLAVGSEIVLPEKLMNKPSVLYPGGEKESISGFREPAVFTSFVPLESTNQPFAAYKYKRSKQHVLSISQSHSLFNIIIPVGHFGEDSAIALVNATRALHGLIGGMFESADVPSQFTFAVKRRTFMRNPVDTLQDSITSMAQAFAFLTNWSEVPGYEDDPAGLFKKLIENGTVAKLARILLLSDLAMANRDLSSPVDALDPSTLTLKDDFSKPLIERQKHYRAARQISTEATDYGCPVAMRNTPVIEADGTERVISESGVNLAARVFVRYFEHYFNNPPVEPQ